MDRDAREEWLEGRQDRRVYPIGRVLRASFDADNHDTLGSDVTGLMIDLSKVPAPPHAAAPATPPVASAASAARSSILARIGGLFGRR